jgi:hypothetical protein
MVGGPLQVLELASSITKTGRHDIAEILLEVKNFESDYFFFLHQNQNIFFSNIRNQNIFLEKKT